MLSIAHRLHSDLRTLKHPAKIASGGNGIAFGILHIKEYEITPGFAGSGLCAEGTARIVSATKRLGTVVFGFVAWSIMLPSKCPPAIIAVKPGNSSVCRFVRYFTVA